MHLFKKKLQVPIYLFNSYYFKYLLKNCGYYKVINVVKWYHKLKSKQ